MNKTLQKALDLTNKASESVNLDNVEVFDFQIPSKSTNTNNLDIAYMEDISQGKHLNNTLLNKYLNK
jgi:hypothetical protein